MHNFDLEVRQLIADCAGVSVDALYSDTMLESIFDDDSHLFFWRSVENRYGWMASHATQEKLATVGAIVAELKRRHRSGQLEGKIA